MCMMVKYGKTFQSFGAQSFLSEAGNLALMLNTDFFQPFKHVTYSLGAIYLTVMNLPRSIRNKQEKRLACWTHSRTSRT